LFDVITGATFFGLLGGAYELPRPRHGFRRRRHNDFKPGFATALDDKDIGLAMMR